MKLLQQNAQDVQTTLHLIPKLRFSPLLTLHPEQLAAMLFSSVLIPKVIFVTVLLVQCVCVCVCVCDSGKIVGINVVAGIADIVCAAVCHAATHPLHETDPKRAVMFVDVGHQLWCCRHCSRMHHHEVIGIRAWRWKRLS